jgi:hypothetical protein
MIVGVMQPYFLPYFEHFRLVAACDLWIVFDIAQFTRKSWMTRNRILNRDKGEAYISLPAKHVGLDIPVRLVPVDDGQDWRRKLFDRLRVYEKEAPNYPQVTTGLAEALTADLPTVSAVNTALLRWACRELGISTPIALCSDMAIDFPADCGPGEWALHVAKAAGASEYRNPSGGKALFDPDLYARHGVALSFHQHRPIAYPTGSFTFVPDLSIVDWMMWNPKAALQDWLAP